MNSEAIVFNHSKTDVSIIKLISSWCEVHSSRSADRGGKEFKEQYRTAQTQFQQHLRPTDLAQA
jgi:hypothetical protein